MGALADLLALGHHVPAHRPWPRAAVDAAAWRSAGDALAEGAASLFSLWGEPEAVHLALLDEQAGAVGVLSLDCPEGRFPSIAARHAPAMRLERAIQDLFGLVAEGLPDARPWLDHGRWGVRAPLGRAEPMGAAPAAASYPFLPAEGEGLHQVPVGPVHAGIIEPGHFRFTGNGETVVRLEQRFGYAHKGIDGLMRGAPLERAARLAGRVSGDSTVAYAWAFAQAVEAALEIVPPPRALALRAVMAELERVANHLGDIGAVCNDAAFALLHAHFGALRELCLRAAAASFGHRLMMDCVAPGGVARDLAAQEPLRALVADVRRALPELIEAYDGTASLQDRTAKTGIASPELVRRFAAGGFVGRASGRGFDARRNLAYAPYDRLHFIAPTFAEGDVDARVRVRIRETEQSLSMIQQLLNELPDGPIRAELSPRAGEGCAAVEAFRGEVFAWARLDGAGRVARCHFRDASWLQWPLLEAAIEGNIIADFPICNKSFNCAYSGHDI